MTRRIPAWGYATDDDPTWFEWPTEEDLYRMQPDVHLQSIEFKDYTDRDNSFRLGSVKVNLSNG